ncbi:MAG: hypothetical protein C0429_06820 [Sphingopyxis sp.]|nr:hypothetical protein [Sphingopyxis sp.]
MALKYLIRLMRYTALSRAIRLGPEDRIAIEFANEMRKAVLEGRLRAVFVHVPNELNRRTAAGAIARALGLIPGTADYLFLHATGAFALECKAPGGVQTENQKDFEEWCRNNSVPYHIFRTVAEGVDLVRKQGVYQ